MCCPLVRPPTCLLAPPPALCCCFQRRAHLLRLRNQAHLVIVSSSTHSAAAALWSSLPAESSHCCSRRSLLTFPSVRHTRLFLFAQFDHQPTSHFFPFFNAILPVIHSTLHWIIHRLLPELLPTSQCRPLFSIYHHFPVKAQNSSAKSDSYLVYLALNPLGLFSLPVPLCSPKHFKHLNPKVHLLKSVFEQRGTSVNSYLRYIHTFPCLYLTFLPERKSLIFVAVERRCSSCSEDGEAARPGPSHSFSLWLQPVNFSCMHCVFSFNRFQMCLNTCKMTAQNAKNLITAYYIYFMSSAIVVLWCPGVFVWFYFGFARANTG